MRLKTLQIVAGLGAAIAFLLAFMSSGAVVASLLFGLIGTALLACLIYGVSCVLFGGQARNQELSHGRHRPVRPPTA